MPYSFTRITRERTQAVKYGVGLLITFYFLIFLVILFILRMCFYEWLVITPPEGSGRFSVDAQIQYFSWLESAIVFILAAAVGGIHFEVSTRNLVPRIMELLRAKAPNPENAREKQFSNILGELSAATGGHRFDGYVVPSRSINSFAAADFQGRNAIGVTYGLLSKLSRPQIEAVCAHEAAHIIKGDALDSTAMVSLFNLPCEILKDMNLDLDNTAVYAARFSMQGMFLYFAFWFMLGLSKSIGILLNLCLLRQREFRADAIAVQLCRDPASLAEALYKASFFWHGIGGVGEYLAPLYIVSPRYNKLEESDGFFAEIFSTHPPLDERLGVLLDMAHLPAEEFEGAMELDKDILMKRALIKSLENDQWMVRIDDRWQGPFSLDAISDGNLAHPETPVKKLGDAVVVLAGEDRLLKEIVKFHKDRDGVNVFCPKCYKILQSETFEGLVLKNCPKCEGLLIRAKDLETVLERRIVPLGSDIYEAAQMIRHQNLFLNEDKNELVSSHQYTCPECLNYQKKMERRFFHFKFHVEIDECPNCHCLWFDKNELEILQCLYEMDKDDKKIV